MNTRIPTFPGLDITYQDWSRYEDEPVFYDRFLYASKVVFERSFLGHSIVDSSGVVFKIVGIRNLERWRKFVPFIKKYELVFQDTGTKMDLEKIRQLMLKGVEIFPENEEFVRHIKGSASIKELIGG